MCIAARVHGLLKHLKQLLTAYIEKWEQELAKPLATMVGPRTQFSGLCWLRHRDPPPRKKPGCIRTTSINGTRNHSHSLHDNPTLFGIPLLLFSYRPKLIFKLQKLETTFRKKCMLSVHIVNHKRQWKAQQYVMFIEYLDFFSNVPC